ncbi:MAG: hypothetical protein OQK69_10150 [Gammaproteobacteria bacterium]|nr:hypothetical protein [Gammaproteobacteria bacterium]
MTRLLIWVFALSISTTCFADGKSALGLDYLQITKSKILTEAMLEMEPALLEYYSKGEWAETTEGDRVYALRGMAIVLSQDHVSVDTYEVIKEVAPEVPLNFLNMDKEKYPNLWNFGELERLIKEKEASLKLYRGLHEKDYVEK